MNTDDLKKKVSLVLNAILPGRDSCENYDQELLLDSMAILELIVGLEKAFGIKIDERNLEILKDFKSLRSITAFVATLLDSKDSDIREK